MSESVPLRMQTRTGLDLGFDKRLRKKPHGSPIAPQSLLGQYKAISE
jgi:hypothetical protein